MDQRQLARRALAVGGTTFGPLLVTLIVAPVLARRLGAERFGVWSLVATSIALAASFDLGLGSAAFRFLATATEPGERQRLLLSGTAVVAGLTAVVAVITTLGSSLLLELVHVHPEVRPEAGQLLPFVAPLVGLPLLCGLLVVSDQVVGRFARPALAGLLGNVVYLIAALTLSAPTLPRLALALLASQLVTLAILLIGRRPARSQPLFLHGERRREVWAFAWRMQVGSAWGFVNLEADALVVALLLPVRDVGYYGLALTVASGLRLLPEVLLRPIYADLSSRAAESREAILALARRQQSIWMTSLSCYAGFALALSSLGTLAWLGPGFRITALVAVVLTAGNLVNLGTAILSTLARVFGRPELEARYGAISAVVNVALTAAFVPWLGLVGVCIGTAVGQVVGSVSFSRIMRPVLQGALPSYLGQVRPVPMLLGLTACVAGCAAVLALAPAGPPALVLAAGWSALVLVALGWRLRASLPWRSGVSPSPSPG